MLHSLLPRKPLIEGKALSTHFLGIFTEPLKQETLFTVFVKALNNLKVVFCHWKFSSEDFGSLGFCDWLLNDCGVPVLLGIPSYQLFSFAFYSQLARELAFQLVNIVSLTCTGHTLLRLIIQYHLVRDFMPVY